MDKVAKNESEVETEGNKCLGQRVIEAVKCDIILTLRPVR